MYKNKIILSLLLGIFCSLASSCNNVPTATRVSAQSPFPVKSSTSTISPVPSKTKSHTKTSTPIPTDTNTVVPTETLTDIPTFTFTPTNLPKQSPEIGLIVTLGEKVKSPWYPGVPVFSPDGKIIALATSRIRFWDIETHELIKEFDNPYPTGCYLSNARFSSDGSLFAVSISGCWIDEIDQGNLLVWDFLTGNLLQEWNLELAHMEEPHHSPYVLPVDAFTFIPNTTKIAYATGNLIEIRDVLDNNETPIKLSLGPDMYADNITVRDDGKFLFVLMDWDKLNTFPSLYKTQFKVQIWQLETETISRIIDFPEIDFSSEGMSLHGEYLLHQNFVKGTFDVQNLSTNETNPYPYRVGWKYFNADMSLMICARLFGFDDDEQIIELWDTDRWRKIYTFLPDFGKDWDHGMHSIAFSPDNTILAIEHQEQISLWAIRAIIQP